MINQWLASPLVETTHFLGRHRTKWLALLFWAVIIGGYWWFTDQYNLSPDAKIKFLADWFVDGIYGPLLFIIFFALQPLVFFPSFLMGIAGGILYGPIQGIIYVLLGANGAANICYVVGRFFGQDILAGKKQSSLMERYAERLRTHTFETILIMHLLIIIPFDIVNYIAGFLRMNWYRFALATSIGALPGIAMFVLFGHSLGTIDDVAAGQPAIDGVMLGLSGLMLALGIGLSQLVKRWERSNPSTQSN